MNNNILKKEERNRRKQKISLVNCEIIQEPHFLHVSSSRVRPRILFEIKYPKKRAQIANINKVEAVLSIKFKK